MFKWSYLVSCIKNYKFNSFFVKNLIIIILLVIVPLNSICLIFYINNNKSTQQEIYNSNLNLAYTIRDVIDNSVNELKLLAINTSLQNDMQSYMLYPPALNTTNPSQVNINQYIKNFTYTHKSLDSIYVYCKKNKTVLSNYIATDIAIFDDSNWFEAYKNMPSDDIKIVLRARNNNYPYYLSIIKPIALSNEDNLGCIVINVNVQKLMNNFKNIDRPSAQDIYVITNEGKILYGNSQDTITKSATNIPFLNNLINVYDNTSTNIRYIDNDYVVSSAKSHFFDWQYYSVMPLNFYNDRFAKLISLVIWLVITSLIVSIIIALYISLRTFQPIKNIIELIDTPEKWMDKLYTDTPKNETAYIIKRIANTLKTNKELENELNARLMILRHAQTVALQSQINPHFLFNTLDTINWIAVGLTKGTNDVSRTIKILADLFKLNIDTSDYMTSLSYELAYTNKYIEILMLRYKDKFTVHWDIDDNTKEFKVPRLALQPIIENAIYHGIKPKDCNGNITITSKIQDKNLIITVFDDGIGIGNDYLTQINQELSEEYIFFGKHVGMKNVNQRIKLIYGNEYGVKVESELNIGTTVILNLPLII